MVAWLLVWVTFLLCCRVWLFVPRGILGNFWNFFWGGAFPHADKRRELSQDLRLGTAWMDPICRELVG